MRYFNQGRFRQQVRFLQHQFLQDGNLPFSDIRRSHRRSFGPHGWTEAAFADHRAISPGTASLESHVDDWTHLPAAALPGRFVAVYRASR